MSKHAYGFGDIPSIKSGIMVQTEYGMMRYAGPISVIDRVKTIYAPNWQHDEFDSTPSHCYDEGDLYCSSCGITDHGAFKVWDPKSCLCARCVNR